MAGIYGAIHDQISYTVCREYYTKLKFAQFHIPAVYHGRVGAAMVGWLATWWMGLVVGAVLIPLGLVIPTVKGYLKGSIKAIAVVCITAFLFGLGALMHGYMAYDTEHLPRYRYPPMVVDKVAFARAGHMHDFSYLGGFAGVATGGIVIFLERARVKRNSQSPKNEER